MSVKKKYGVLVLLLMFSLTACSGNNAQQAVREAESGQTYLEEEDYEAAAQAFTAALEADPEEISDYIGLIEAYTGMQDYESAVSAADAAFEVLSTSEIELSEEEMDSLVDAAAEACENLNDADRQYDFWMVLSESVPEDSRDTIIERGTNALVRLGQTYVESEDYGQAEAAFGRAMELTPSEPDYYLELAELLVIQGNYKEGIAVLENGCEKTGDENLYVRQEELRAEWLTVLEAELTDIVEQIEVQYTVDDVQLGVTEMEEVAETYEDRDGVKLSYFTYEGVSHLSTVMSYYGKNGNTIAEGYEEGDIDFYFESLYVSQTVARTVDIANPDFLCAGSLRVGDDYTKALELYGLEDVPELCVDGYYNLNLTEQGKVLHVFDGEDGTEAFWYYEEDGVLKVEAVDGKIYKIIMTKY
ncbi:MAG: tetratricopeptide repeat protein [Lachnospiraceae bacterium]|nr:tetratricopeptide repeat protein [Lachnospiraceae bacterium]